MKTIPAGAPLADSIKTLLLKKDLGLPVSEGVPSVLYRRWFLGLAQSMYMLLGALLGFYVIRQGSISLFGAPGLEWAALLISILMMSVLLVLPLVAPPGKTARSIFLMLKRIPIDRFRNWMVSHRGSFITADRFMLAIKDLGTRRIARTVGWFLAAWFAEAAETYLFLMILGIPTTVVEAVALETLVSSIRLAMFFLPAGIGAQEVGYAGLMVAFGMVGSPTDAAMFILMKRAKDLLWIGLGYVLLLIKGIRPSRKSIAVQLS